MIDEKDGHIPLPLIMFTSTALRHALLERQTNKSVPIKASNLKLKMNRPVRLNYFNYKNNSGKNPSCCAAMGHKLLTSPRVADTNRLFMNTCNPLPESYEPRVYKTTLATVKCQIQQRRQPNAYRSHLHRSSTC